MNCLEFCAGNISPLSFTLSFTKPPFSWFVQVISMGLGMGNCQTSCQDRVYYLLLAWKGLVTSSTQLNTWNSWIWLLKSEFVLSIVFFCFFNLIWCRSKNSKSGRNLSKIQRILITSSYFPTQHPTFMMIRTVAGLFSFIWEISILLQRSLRCSGEPQVPFLEMPIVCITFHVYFSY